MKIKFHGHACFSINDGDFTLVTDPYNEETGLKMPKVKASVVSVSHKHPHHNNVEGVEGEPRVFNWPGEYETGGVHFRGISSFHNAKEDKEQAENTIFTTIIKGVKFCHLGDLGTKLTPEQLEKVGDIDVLFVPVGGVDTIDAKKAKEVIEQIEPRMVIPMVYNTDGSTVGLADLQPFLNEMGAQNIEAQDLLSLKRSDLPEDNSKVVVLNPTV